MKEPELFWRSYIMASPKWLRWLLQNGFDSSGGAFLNTPLIIYHYTGPLVIVV